MVILVTGAESSGTRLAARILNRMGAQTIHRSYPHGGQWPIFSELHFDGAVVMVRDWGFAAESQVDRGHVQTKAQAYRHLARAAVEVPLQLAGRCPWLTVAYGALVAHPEVVTATLAEFFGLNADVQLEPIYDANARRAA